MDRKIVKTDQSPNVALTTNRESTKEMASPKKFFPDIKSKDFIHERKQVNILPKKNHNLFEKYTKLAFTDSKVE